MKHPKIPDSTIYLGGDMGHCVKKNRNNARMSGMGGESRELVLDGKPISLRMLQDIYEKTPDVKDESALIIYRKSRRSR